MVDSLSYGNMNDRDLSNLNKKLNKEDALGIIKWAFQTFGNDVIYSCSFGAEGMVMLNLISKIRPDAKVVFLDTHFHFKETYQLIEEVQATYPELNIEKLPPTLTAPEQAEKYGDRLWERDPDRCCHIRKVLPLQNKLSAARAWFSGLRREQSPSRAKVQFVNLDHKFQSIKICPLIHWTWEDIWLYIDTFKLPYNPLHDQGYPSIGCEYCTFRTEINGSREGRWRGTGKTECGLHADDTPKTEK